MFNSIEERCVENSMLNTQLQEQGTHYEDLLAKNTTVSDEVISTMKVFSQVMCKKIESVRNQKIKIDKELNMCNFISLHTSLTAEERGQEIKKFSKNIETLKETELRLQSEQCRLNELNDNLHEQSNTLLSNENRFNQEIESLRSQIEESITINAESNASNARLSKQMELLKLSESNLIAKQSQLVLDNQDIRNELSMFVQRETKLNHELENSLIQVKEYSNLLMKSEEYCINVDAHLEEEKVRHNRMSVENTAMSDEVDAMKVNVKEIQKRIENEINQNLMMDTVLNTSNFMSLHAHLIATERALVIVHGSEHESQLLVKQHQLQRENDNLRREASDLLESEVSLQLMVEKLSSHLHENSKVLLDSSEHNASLNRQLQDEQEKNKNLMTKNDASVKIIDAMNCNILELRSKVESEIRQNLDSNFFQRLLLQSEEGFVQ